MDLKSFIDRLVCDPRAKRAQDKAAIDKLVAGFEAMLEARGVEPSPFVVLRMHDVITQYRIARRIERDVFADGAWGEPANHSENGHANGAKHTASKRENSSHSDVEPLAKAWDRMRKALHELEAVCGAEKNDHVPSLADLATPLLERADGVLEEAIAAENERMREMRALEERNRELEAKLSCVE